MVAGLNLRATIWQMNHDIDDEIGGAMITGTMAYQDILMRLTARRPSPVSLEAGLEVDRFFDMVLVGHGLTIHERDEVQVTWPVDHPYYNERFRVIAIQLDGRRRSFGHTQCTLSRIERSRRQQ